MLRVVPRWKAAARKELSATLWETERWRDKDAERKREGGSGRAKEREDETARGGLRADGAGRNGREIAAIMRRNSSHNKTPLLK